ncbi:MAG: DMT family transporter [Rhodospirillaceae bacterium]|nr:DMT family transporter [Rhodospirillaceae bacterium]MBT3628690.1 DMT family transporter [Rhodospirillaceae bacterium]MBT3925574.1 DMT family transporter [Rhodospirillaceae bacterium]MBT4425672.1 DMT family transporter [Rhodospirillaceae bacterium]MBT5037610.1 DMT family transporter [Rhodospirillaceae bacterium]
MIPRTVLGVLFAITAGVCFSSGGYFVRSVSIDSWEIIALRCFFAAIAMIILFVVRERGRTIASLRASALPSLFIGVITGWAIIAYVLAMQLTLVANVTAIMTTSTLIVALLARPFLGERVPLHTWFAMVGGLVGIGVMFSGAAGAGSLYGNLLAFTIALAIALQTLIARKFRHVQMEPAVFVAALVAGIAALPMALPFTASGHDVAMMAAFGVVQLAVPLTLYFYAARYLAAPTLIFVVLIDAVLAPVWVWLGFDEVPTRLAFIGAVVILVSVGFNAGLSVRKLGRAPATD